MKYLCDPHVIPAVMPRDLDALTELATKFGAFTDYIHLDIMDGSFAPNAQWPYAANGQRASGEIRLPEGVLFEIHLMVREARELGLLFARAGASRIIAHVEAFENTRDIPEAFSAWKEAGGTEVGLALKIDTPLSAIEELAGLCDIVQVMSISEIGYQGRSFDERALSRVEELHALYPTMMVAVDGGVTEATVELLVRAGANRFVVGGALTQSDRPEITYAKILERAMQGCVPLALESTI